MADNEALLTVKEAATYLRIHEDSLRKWVREGKLTCGRVGLRGDMRFRRADLDSLIGLPTPANSLPADIGGGRPPRTAPTVEEGDPPIA
jgi:excisionase family DNA binding protein